jgi:hypothetical protein
MDSWLLQMKTSFDKLDEINKQVSYLLTIKI